MSQFIEIPKILSLNTIFLQNQSSILCYVQNDRIRVLMHPFSINYNQSSQAIN